MDPEEAEARRKAKGKGPVEEEEESDPEVRGPSLFLGWSHPGDCLAG